jgi:hypothetical protein
MNLSSFSDLLASQGLDLLPGSYAVPVSLLVGLPDAGIARFTARGTTLRLRVYSPDALTSVMIAPECGCAAQHPRTGPHRLVLRSSAVPLVERVIDGALRFGWHSHEAGLLRLADASPWFFELLDQITQDRDVPTGRTLVAVA